MSDEIVTDECIDTFHELLLNCKWQYIIFRFSDDRKSIIVEEKGSPGISYDTFLTKLRKPKPEMTPETTPEPVECRYAVFDIDFIAKAELTHLLFIGWIPEEAPEEEKTLYATNLEILERSLVGIQICVVCHHFNELSYANILQKIQGNKFVGAIASK
ncbi:hypothetical protein ACJMK2_036718 [Sinanodonta woodiana]|uniref:ADF-H domain-containing protein n=1 Tax=Sinanodonta woodiana TaxID=1069815 RepID=A0ABD3WLH2_SINWO